jgi:hypothetical protein
MRPGLFDPSYMAQKADSSARIPIGTAFYKGGDTTKFAGFIPPPDRPRRQAASPTCGVLLLSAPNLWGIASVVCAPDRLEGFGNSVFRSFFAQDFSCLESVP